MEHLAIMRKSWGLTQKILSGQKKIESRWYSIKCKPWDCIKEGEIIYFKDSGEPAKIKAEVERVIQFSDLTPKKVKEILDEYGKEDGLEKKAIPEFFERFKNKKYCILIFLKNPQKIEPFNIDKTGFGAMSAWITVNDISEIKNNSCS
ncbi:MAG: ASCH domain-containing protein [Patescibacteria group bacterium]